MATIGSDITGYSSDHSYYALNNPTYGEGDSTSTDYARINLSRGSGAATYMYWLFTLPAIPADATIDSITCNYKARVSSSSTSYIRTATIQLYSGTTAKGSSQSIRTTSTAASSISSPGTWTAAEVNAGVRLRVDATRGTSRTTSNYYVYFYGADIEIEYTEASGEKMLVKAGGAWQEVQKVYRKVNGAWVEQSDLTGIFSEGQIIIKGN